MINTYCTQTVRLHGKLKRIQLTETTVTTQISWRVLYVIVCLEGHTYPVPAKTVSAMISTLFVDQRERELSESWTYFCSYESNLFIVAVEPVKKQNWEPSQELLQSKLVEELTEG